MAVKEDKSQKKIKQVLKYKLKGNVCYGGVRYAIGEEIEILLEDIEYFKQKELI